MTTLEQVRREYDSQAEGYNNIAHLPRNILKAQLLEIALGDCTGLHILDFGGGSGLEARQAIALGASSVDIIDLSDEMLRVALDAEKKLGRRGKIRVFQADAAKPIHHLLSRPRYSSASFPPNGSASASASASAPSRPAQRLLEQYDIVMSNFCFDHASSREQLEGMWRNATSLLKPGGIFVLTRVKNVRSPAGTSGKYGIAYKDIQEYPGGVRYKFVAMLKEPIEFEVTTLEMSYAEKRGEDLMMRCGLTNIEEVKPERARAVQEDPEFWDMFVRDPSIAVVKAIKAFNTSEA